jgi:hypothetical protein
LNQKEEIMAKELHPEGNGAVGKGLVDIIELNEGCTLFGKNPQHPPPDREMPFAIGEVLQKWMQSNPLRIRTTFPVVSAGNTVGLFVWWDRVD